MEQTSATSSATEPAKCEKSQCVSCNEKLDVFCVASGPCKHEYCQDCLRTVIEYALVDEALFPPGCCRQPFIFDEIKRFLTPELISEYNLKKVEYETPNRIYCANSKCSMFLYAENITGDEALCPACCTFTCTICKGHEHAGDCPEDVATKEVLDLAADEGWRRCGKCSRMIDLRVGCNHITYVCHL